MPKTSRYAMSLAGERPDTLKRSSKESRGELHADVHDHKLRGRLILVRRGRDRSGQDQRLLPKRGQHAVRLVAQGTTRDAARQGERVARHG